MVERPFLVEKETVVRSFSASDDLMRALRQYAYDKHARSVSSVVAKAVQEFLAREGYWSIDP